MSKIPCKICKSCGFYHDLSVMTCTECDTSLQAIPAIIIETETIPDEKYGKIEEAVPVFVQICSACGEPNFTADKNSPVTRCYKCHKVRIASIEPEVYHSADDDSAENGADAAKTAVQADGSAKTDEVSPDDDDDGVAWDNTIGNINRATGKKDPNPAENGGAEPAPEKTATSQQMRAITLTAVTYGNLSFTIEARPDETYLLGRSAKQSAFLSKDGRVSNQHCYLYFKNGSWYVKDNHSANGTAVNARDLGLDGESVLNDGDELKLGHHPDSMAFKIKIG